MCVKSCESLATLLYYVYSNSIYVHTLLCIYASQEKTKIGYPGLCLYLFNRTSLELKILEA